jgi:hypothetical protein
LILAAAYVVRSVMRGFDFRPDLPLDAVAIALIALVLGLVAYSRATQEDESAVPGLEPGPADSHETTDQDGEC